MLISRRTCIKLMEDALQEPVRINCGLVGRSGPRIHGQSTAGAVRKGSRSGFHSSQLPLVVRSAGKNFFLHIIRRLRLGRSHRAQRRDRDFAMQAGKVVAVPCGVFYMDLRRPHDPWNPATSRDFRRTL